jgi:phenylacetate-CoA ligase
LPVLTRSILNSWNDDDRLALGRKACDTYFVGTSGSSGKSLKVFYDQNAAIVETLESFKQYASYINEPLPADRWIYNIHMSRGWLSSLLGDYRTFTLNEVPPLNALIEHFEKLRPIILCALPSHLLELAPIGDLTRFGIRAISTNSEQSSRVERDKLSRIFGVPVLDEYSSVELGVIAYECSAGNYHVNEEGLHVELLDIDNSGFGRVVATDLRSWVMPLIRYDQGDLASWDKHIGTCSCAKPGTRFSEIRGRADDYFLRNDGAKVSSATLLNLVDTLFTGPESTLKEFRLVQETTTKVRFEFVIIAGETLPMSSRNQLIQSLKTNIGSAVEIEFVQLGQLSETPSYKRKKVIRAFA